MVNSLFQTGKTESLFPSIIGYRTADNFPIYNQTDHSLVTLSERIARLSVNACKPIHHSFTNLYVMVNCSDYTKAANLQRAGAAAVILSSLKGQDRSLARLCCYSCSFYTKVESKSNASFMIRIPNCC